MIVYQNTELVFMPVPDVFAAESLPDDRLGIRNSTMPPCANSHTLTSSSGHPNLNVPPAVSDAVLNCGSPCFDLETAREKLLPLSMFSEMTSIEERLLKITTEHLAPWAIKLLLQQDSTQIAVLGINMTKAVVPVLDAEWMAMLRPFRVYPEFRGSGIGSLWYRTIEDYLRSCRIKAVATICAYHSDMDRSYDDAATFKFWRKQGFNLQTQIEYHRGLYGDDTFALFKRLD